MRFHHHVVLSALCLGLPVFHMACAEELTNTIDCARICNRYSDCVTDIDVTSCTDKCEDDADATETVEIQLETCEDCVDNGSCSEIDDCWSDCPVVPVQD